MKIKINSIASNNEQIARQQLLKLFNESSIPDNELINNLGLFTKRQEFSKYIYFNEIYKKLLNVHGVIMEFGTRWGQNLVTLNNLRGMYEPFNYNRRIIGFDTFEGFKNTDPNKDGLNEIIEDGAFSVTEKYENELEQILTYHETESPLSHIKKNFIYKGDAAIKLKEYLTENPQTIIAFAYFDFDIYTPTLECLKLIKPHLTKGSIIGFDELNDPKFPGETLAFREVFEINNFSIKRFNFGGIQSYLVFKP